MQPALIRINKTKVRKEWTIIIRRNELMGLLMYHKATLVRSTYGAIKFVQPALIRINKIKVRRVDNYIIAFTANQNTRVYLQDEVANRDKGNNILRGSEKISRIPTHPQ